MIQNKKRLATILIIVSALILTMVATVVLLIIPQNNKKDSNSLTSYTLLAEGANLLNTTANGGGVNSTVAQALLEAVGGDNASMGYRSKSNLGTITVKMGSYDYQVVCRQGNYITLWMCTGSTSIGAHTLGGSASSTLYYDQTSLYRSYLQNSSSSGFYSRERNLYSSLTSIIAGPSVIGSVNPYNQADTPISSYFINNKLRVADYFYLPSCYEVNSVWGLSAVDRNPSETYHCWLRSIQVRSTNAYYPMVLNTSGNDEMYEYWHYTAYVRPAVTINLNTLNSLSTGYNTVIQFNSYCGSLIKNASTGTMNITINNSNNYQVASFTQSSDTKLPLFTEPEEFTIMPNYQYKFWVASNTRAYLILNNITADLTFTINSRLYNSYSPIVKKNTELITDTTVTTAHAESYMGTICDFTASYNSNHFPRISVNDSNSIDLLNSAGKAQLDNYIITYNYTQGALRMRIINLLPLPAINYIYLDLAGETPYNVLLTKEGVGTAKHTVAYDMNGGASVSIIPASGYYVTSISTGNGYAYTPTETETILTGQIYSARYCFVTVSNYSNELRLYFMQLSGDINVVYNLTAYRPTYTEVVPGSVATITGTAVNATNGGEARIVGSTVNDLLDEDTITFVAVPYKGYSFSGWAVDDELLLNSEGQSYGVSANIAKSQVEGKVVTAVFVSDYIAGQSPNELTNKQIYIYSANDLWLISQQSNQGVDFTGFVITLCKDINMSSVGQDGKTFASKWQPLGSTSSFNGTFVYNGYTISGILQLVDNCGVEGAILTNDTGLYEMPETNSNR